MSTGILLISTIIVFGLIVYLLYKAVDMLIEASDPKKDPRFFCQIPQGKVVIIVRGGQASKYIGNPGDGLYLNPRTGKINPIAEVKEKEYEGAIDQLLRKRLGLAWISIGRVHIQKDFEFKEMKNGKLEIRKIDTPYVKVQHTYAEWVDEMDTLDQHQVKILQQIVFLTRDVAQMVFGAGKNWIDGSFGSIKAVDREFTSNTPYRDVLKEKGESVSSTLLKMILCLNEEDVGNRPLISYYGVEITGSNFVDIKNMNPEMQNAVTQKALAEERGGAKIRESELNAKTLEINSTAEAKAKDAATGAEERRIKKTGMAQVEVNRANVEVDEARVKAYNGNPPETAGAKALGDLKDLKGTLIIGGDKNPIPFLQVNRNL